MQLTAVFVQVPEGGYVAFVEELPGANTQGSTLEEARENLREAVAGHREQSRTRQIVAPRLSRDPRTARAHGMQLRDLVSHLESTAAACSVEGGRHSVYVNPATNATSAVPRHTEIYEYLAHKICRDLQVPRP